MSNGVELYPFFMFLDDFEHLRSIYTREQILKMYKDAFPKLKVEITGKPVITKTTWKENEF